MRTNNLKTKKKRTFAALLLFALLAPTVAWAQFGGGDGSQGNPYIITTTDHLTELANNVNGGNPYDGKYFRLDANLDFTGKTYTPIGTEDNKFRGIFMGKNYTINNVTISSPYNPCGLFGVVGNGGKIYDLGLFGQSSIEAVGMAGGIAGELWPNAEIVGCDVDANVVITVHPRGNDYGVLPGRFGGIVGENIGGTVKNCISRATVSNAGIEKTKRIGGIVGLGSGTVENCFFLGEIAATGSTYVGDIVGDGSATLTGNYYHTANPVGGVDGNDTDGARWMGTIGFQPPVSGTRGIDYVFVEGFTQYYGAGNATNVYHLNYAVQEGYTPVGTTYWANGTIPVTPSGSYHQFTMPAEDVVITGTVEAVKRDIGYSAWVSVSAEPQDYTGEPLTPTVTVTDNMSGTPVTLAEGVHYTITLPNGGCIYPGDYDITVAGMGNFGGQATAVFTIINPGSGTEDNPYLIRNTEQMDALATSVNGGDNKSGVHFRLEADLDYSGKTYTIVGTQWQNPFRGFFDGNGHTISHVSIDDNTSYYLGLFGYVDEGGTVKNLTLDHSSINNSNQYGGHTAGIVGSGNNASIITRCIVTENVTVSANKGYVGGIVGRCFNATVSDCLNSGSVNSTAAYDSNGAVGGIGGQVNGSTISNCRNIGSVGGSRRIGGIAGNIYDTSGISDCLNLGGVSGSELVGGIAGNKTNSVTFTNNYYAGNCTTGGINGNDVAGAVRGYIIEAQPPIGISLEGSIGLFYEGKVYAGANQEVLVGLEVNGSSYVPQCLSFSAGTYNNNGDGTFTITMPAENITVMGNILEHDGLYYELSCNGDNTATLIRDDSYAMLQSVYIDEYITANETDYFVTAIANNTFDGCDSIMWFDCHAQLTTIGDYAFRNCTSLEYLGFYNGYTPPTLGEGVFEGLRIDTLLIMVPFCSRYEYAIHPVWGQFGEIQPDGECEYNFTNQYGSGDRLWSNPENWAEGEVPGEGAQVGIMSDCEMDADVMVGSITIGGYYDEEYGCYEHLTVKDGATLTATSFIYNSGDARNFVIEDGAQVIIPNTGAEASVEKNISAYTPNSKNGWHLVSSPAIESFAPTADNGFLANEYDLYFYEESTHHWRNHKPNGQYAGFGIEPLKGYLYANSANDTLQLQGTLRTAMETVNIPLSCTSGIDLAGFNLVGNPFAHNVTAFTGTNIADEVYRMNGTKDNLMVSVIDGDNPLLPGEGFFVKATGDDASITFNSRATNAERSNITLEVSENGLVVDRFILKRDGAPLEKFTLNENSTRVYATEDAQDWAVAVIASDSEAIQPTEQAVNFKAAKNGTYSLTVSVENMDLDYLHLIDNMTGADIDLLTPAGNSPSERGLGGVYTFTAQTTDYASRFRLVFDANDASTGSATDAPFAYINNGNIVINGTGTLQIIDILGKELVRKELTTLNSQLTTLNFVPGVYVLRLIDGDSIRTQKIVVD